MSKKSEVAEYVPKKKQRWPLYLAILIVAAALVVPNVVSLNGDKPTVFRIGESANEGVVDDGLPKISLPRPTQSVLDQNLAMLPTFLSPSELTVRFSSLHPGKTRHERFLEVETYVNDTETIVDDVGAIATTTSDWKTVINVTFGYEVTEASNSGVTTVEQNGKMLVKQKVHIKFKYPLDENNQPVSSPVIVVSHDKVWSQTTPNIVDFEPSARASEKARNASIDKLFDGACSEGVKDRVIAGALEATQKHWQNVLGTEYSNYVFDIEVDTTSIRCD